MSELCDPRDLSGRRGFQKVWELCWNETPEHCFCCLQALALLTQTRQHCSANVVDLARNCELLTLDRKTSSAIRIHPCRAMNGRRAAWPCREEPKAATLGKNCTNSHTACTDLCRLVKLVTRPSCSTKSWKFQFWLANRMMTQFHRRGQAVASRKLKHLSC